MPRKRRFEDWWHQLSAEERNHPLFILIQPHNFALLATSLKSLKTNPRPLDKLHDWLCEAVPDFGAFYQQNPTATRMFHIDDTLRDLRAVPPGQRARVVVIQLMCLKLSQPWPPRSILVTGPTSDWCKGRATYLATEDGLIVHFSETSRVCLFPPLEARSKRRKLAGTCGPTRLMYKVMGMLVSAEMISLKSFHNADIVGAYLAGTWALHVADVDGRPSSINLVPLSAYSRLFGMEVQLDYHPRVTQSSRFWEVRALSLLRQVYTDAICFGLNGCEARYSQLAGLVSGQIPDFRTLTLNLAIDPADESLAAIKDARATVSRVLQDFIKNNGTGTHGGPFGGGSQTGAGGCGSRPTALRDKDGNLASLPTVACFKDIASMRIYLEEAGFWVESYDDSQIKEKFETALPLLELRSVLFSFQDQELRDFALEDLTDESEETVATLLEAYQRASSSEVEQIAALKAVIEQLSEVEEDAMPHGEVGAAPQNADPLDWSHAPVDVEGHGVVTDGATEVDDYPDLGEAFAPAIANNDVKLRADDPAPQKAVEARQQNADIAASTQPSTSDASASSKAFANLSAQSAICLEGLVFRGFSDHDMAKQTGLTRSICHEARIYFLTSALRDSTRCNYSEDDQLTAEKLADAEVWKVLQEEAEGGLAVTGRCSGLAYFE